MIIGMIFHSLNVPGGSASVFLSLAVQLQKQGHDIHVFCYYYNSRQCFPELNKDLKVHYVKKIDLSTQRINNNSLFNRFILGIDYYINSRKIYPLMKKYSLDLVFASEACSYVPALLYKKQRRVPVIWSVFDPISLVDNKRPGLITHKYRWFSKILSIHNVFDSRNIRKIDRVIVPTKKMKSQLDLFYKIDSTVLPIAGVRADEGKRNHEDLIKKRIRTKFNFSKKDEVILFSNGHFLPHRRYEDVLDAMSILVKKGYSLRYIISGSSSFDPVYFNKLQNKLKSLKLNDYVFFDTEFKSNKEIFGYYQYCDIFLFVSVEQTWGLAPFEAMACKKPVIISKGVGCSEVLTQKKDALIVNERSPKEIASCIKLLIHDPVLARKIAEGGYQRTSRDFTYEGIAKKIVSTMSENI